MLFIELCILFIIYSNYWVIFDWIWCSWDMYDNGLGVKVVKKIFFGYLVVFDFFFICSISILCKVNIRYWDLYFRDCW